MLQLAYGVHRRVAVLCERDAVRGDDSTSQSTQRI
jgi:hypothetical protein